SPITSSGSGGRQLEPKPAAGAGSGFDPEAATHSLDGLGYNSQTNTGAFVKVGRFVKALKDAEDSLLIFRLYANTVIHDPHAHLAVHLLGTNADTGFLPWGNEL